MQYILKKHANGQWQAALLLPQDGGDLAAIGRALSKSEATVNAARVAVKAAPTTSKPAQTRKKAALASALAKTAANPILRSALRSGGIEAAKAIASTLPGGSLALKALDMASKFKPAKAFLRKLIRF